MKTKSFDFYKNVVFRNRFGSHKILKTNKIEDIKILGLIRVRDESLILKDTLDHMSAHVDAIILFDDSSNDDTLNIALHHPTVTEVIVNKKWRTNRTWEETANRRMLLKRGLKYNPTWFFYFDADERFEGGIKDFLIKDEVNSGVRISLFDAYMTKGDYEPYSGGQLLNFRKYFGIEQRDILMIWRNLPGIDYVLPDSREPQGVTGEITKFYCQHYGKSLSVDHWETTCDYYINNFPQYSDKWKLRKGKAIHTKSDFNTLLYLWDDVKNKGKMI